MIRKCSNAGHSIVKQHCVWSKVVCAPILDSVSKRNGFKSLKVASLWANQDQWNFDHLTPKYLAK